jgi:hypothetical protein
MSDDAAFKIYTDGFKASEDAIFGQKDALKELKKETEETGDALFEQDKILKILTQT